MSTIVNNFPLNVASGSQNLGPAAVPDADSSLLLHLTRCTTATPTMWPNESTFLQCDIFISTDGGATYPTVPQFSLGSFGGILIGNDKVTGNPVELPETKLRVDLPPGTNRKLKATVTVTNGPLVSACTIEAS